MPFNKAFGTIQTVKKISGFNNQISMKLSLVGPTYPYRGGIAHYTTLLYRSLKKKYEVKFYAFRRQYPKWLFPGKTDKDVSKVAIKEDDVENILDSMNPITWWKTFYRIKMDASDLLIIPWWISFWTPQFWSITSLVRKFTSTKVLFICHNIVQHESRLWDRVCMKLVLKNGHYFIVHSDEDLNNLKEIFPKANVKKTFHPTYKVFKQNGFDKAKARTSLGLSRKTILFFGFVRKYKGLCYLIEALPHILKQIDVTLLIVGEFWKDKSAYLEQIKKLAIEEHVRIIDRYIPNEEVNLYFSACDLVVLPYTSATGSGIVQIAFGCERPVITTRVGSLAEVVEDGKTGYLVESQDADSLAAAVVRFYRHAKEEEFVNNIRAAHENFSWEKMRSSIEELCCAQ